MQTYSEARRFAEGGLSGKCIWKWIIGCIERLAHLMPFVTFLPTISFIILVLIGVFDGEEVTRIAFSSIILIIVIVEKSIAVVATLIFLIRGSNKSMYE